MEIYNLQEVLKTFAVGNDKCIFISGPWGIGKTYWLHNFKQRHNKGTDFQIAYSSCFGKQSTDEINTELYKSIYGENKTNKLLATAGIAYGVLKQVLSIPSVVGTIITETGKATKNRQTPNKLKEHTIVIIDDIERIDKAKIKIEFDLWGYINSLVDGGVKVVLVADATRLDKSKEQRKENGVGEENETDEWDKFIEKICDRRYVINDVGQDNFERICRECKMPIIPYRVFKEQLDNNLRMLFKAKSLFDEIKNKGVTEKILTKHDLFLLCALISQEILSHKYCKEMRIKWNETIEKEKKTPAEFSFAKYQYEKFDDLAEVMKYIVNQYGVLNNQIDPLLLNYLCEAIEQVKYDNLIGRIKFLINPPKDVCFRSHWSSLLSKSDKLVQANYWLNIANLKLLNTDEIISIISNIIGSATSEVKELFTNEKRQQLFKLFDEKKFSADDLARHTININELLKEIMDEYKRRLGKAAKDKIVQIILKCGPDLRSEINEIKSEYFCHIRETELFDEFLQEIAIGLDDKNWYLMNLTDTIEECEVRRFQNILYLLREQLFLQNDKLSLEVQWTDKTKSTIFDRILQKIEQHRASADKNDEVANKRISSIKETCKYYNFVKTSAESEP